MGRGANLESQDAERPEKDRMLSATASLIEPMEGRFVVARAVRGGWALAVVFWGVILVGCYGGFWVGLWITRGWRCFWGCRDPIVG